MDHLDDFKKRVKDLTVDAFHGMGTNMTSGLQHVQSVFIKDGMTQDDRDSFGTNTNKVSKQMMLQKTNPIQTEKVLILFSNGHSEDRRMKVMDMVNQLEHDDVHILPLSVTPRESTCFENPLCADGKFLNTIKDDDLEYFLDSTKGFGVTKNSSLS